MYVQVVLEIHNAACSVPIKYFVDDKVKDKSARVQGNTVTVTFCIPRTVGTK